MGRNPQTGEPIKIPAKRVVKFRLAKSPQGLGAWQEVTTATGLGTTAPVAVGRPADAVRLRGRVGPARDRRYRPAGAPGTAIGSSARSCSSERAARRRCCTGPWSWRRPTPRADARRRDRRPPRGRTPSSSAEAEGIDTVYTRPQGLDRIWVRSGFIPIPEAELPRGLQRPTGRRALRLARRHRALELGRAAAAAARRRVAHRRPTPPLAPR